MTTTLPRGFGESPGSLASGKGGGEDGNAGRIANCSTVLLIDFALDLKSRHTREAAGGGLEVSVERVGEPGEPEKLRDDLGSGEDGGGARQDMDSRCVSEARCAVEGPLGVCLAGSRMKPAMWW